MATQLVMEVVEPRRCAVCAEVLVRRDGEKTSKFKARQTCGRQCWSKLSGLSQRKATEAACQYCGTSFMVRPCEAEKGKRFCSQRCYDRWRGEGHLAGERFTLQCQSCGRDYLVKPSGAKSKYCSRRCQADGNRGRPSPRLGKKSGTTFKCEQCGVSFVCAPGLVASAERKGQQIRYCSRACYNHVRSQRNVQRVCQECGVTFSVQAARAEYDERGRNGSRYALFCSVPCKSAFYGRQRENRVVVSCVVCGSRIERNLYRIKAAKRHYCSDKCKGAEVHTWSFPQTHYKVGFREDLGHAVRSTWEANVCRILRHLRLEYEYEPKSFRVGESRYAPDLWVPAWNCWIEVKGQLRPDAEAKLAEFRRLYPEERLVLLDKSLYRILEKEFRHRIPEWEWQRLPARLTGGDRRRKENRRALAE